MKKFKNYSFMTGLVSAILMVIVQVLAAFDIYISSETVSNILSVVLGALVVLGVINKPSESDKAEIIDKIDDEESTNNNNEEDKMDM